MDLRIQLQRFRQEHDDILRFLREWEGALNLAASETIELRRKGLAQLIEMESKLAEIREHCHDEEESIDSPFQLYLDDAALEHLRQEHDLLDRLSEGFRSELRLLTTPPPAGELAGMGLRLLEQLRHHIAFEEGLLKQIEEGNAAEEKLFLRYSYPAE